MALQRQVELAPGALGFRYDTGLYLQFRATAPDDFHLAYAAALATAGRFADADEIVNGLTERRPSWRAARWVAVVINYRAERWSDVVKLLTPIVNDADLDEAFSHAAKITLGTALARLGMFAPALSYLEEPDGPVAVAAVDGALAKALVLRAHVDEESASEVLQDLYAAHPENEQIEQRPVRHQFRDRDHHGGPDRGPHRSMGPRHRAQRRATSSTRRPTSARPCCWQEAERQLAEFIGLERSKTRCRG